MSTYNTILFVRQSMACGVAEKIDTAGGRACAHLSIARGGKTEEIWELNKKPSGQKFLPVAHFEGGRKEKIGSGAASKGVKVQHTCSTRQPG